MAKIAKIAIILLAFLVTSCGVPKPEIEMQQSPFLLSILGTSLSLAPNTNPVVHAEISGNAWKDIIYYSLKVTVLREEKELRRSEDFQEYEPLLIGEEIPQNTVIYKEWQVWGYWYFDRVIISINTVKFKGEGEKYCNPEFQDCQETLICLKSAESCGGWR